MHLMGVSCILKLKSQRKNDVTVPHSLEQLEVLAAAAGSSATFPATGGENFTSDDMSKMEKCCQGRQKLQR